MIKRIIQSDKNTIITTDNGEIIVNLDVIRTWNKKSEECSQEALEYIFHFISGHQEMLTDETREELMKMTAKWNGLEKENIIQALKTYYIRENITINISKTSITIANEVKKQLEDLLKSRNAIEGSICLSNNIEQLDFMIRYLSNNENIREKILCDIREFIVDNRAKIEMSLSEENIKRFHRNTAI